MKPIRHEVESQPLKEVYDKFFPKGKSQIDTASENKAIESIRNKIWIPVQTIIYDQISSYIKNEIEEMTEKNETN